MRRFFLVLPVLLLAAPEIASARSFPDVPESHHAYEAVEYLKEKGILQGYPDGTFQPQKLVNRAEALKIIVAPISFADHTKEPERSSYLDVDNTVWFFPYVQRAYETLRIIDGPPTTHRFFPERTVVQSEFLKMLLLAHNVNMKRDQDFVLALSSDAENTRAWFYTYTRYALSASMLQADSEGSLNLDQYLSRADIAILLYHFLLHTENARTQALIDQSLAEIVRALDELSTGEFTKAEHSSARALLRAHGAMHVQGDEPAVQGVRKNAEAFRALLFAYQAERDGDVEEINRLASACWQAAEEAKELSPELRLTADRMQMIARELIKESE